MGMPIPDEGPPDEDKEESDGPQRPPRARTALDMKDRAPKAFQTFITFDFEPDDASSPSPTGSRNPAGRRGSRTSSRVAIDYFDREGVEHLRSRFSSASEYSTYLTENRSAMPSTRVAARRGDNMSERSTVDYRKRLSQCRKNISGPREVTNNIASSACKMRGPCAGKQLAPFDLEAALRETIKQHGSRNAARRTLGLGFRDLSVFGADRSLSSHTIYQPTLWSTLSPIEWARKLVRMRKRVPSRIISGFEGVVNPGEMLLVLGRPGSGCSTLLKVLANQTKEFVHVLGERRYDALTPRDVCLSFRDKVWYSPEAGVYPPSLTVQQTIFFAARTQIHDGHQSHDIAEEVAVTLMTIFGLRHIKDTLMGDTKITQAERRRVSICEAVATQVSVCCWDKPYQGLDACGALEFVQALRIATDLSAMTTIVALSQAGESLYQLFDKVCVIGDGRLLYYGRADAARSYFTDLGYDPLPRQSTPDFLISVTDPAGRIQNPARPFSTPRTPEEFTRAFHRSPLGRTNRLEVATYWQDNVERASNAERRWNVRLPKVKKSKLIQTSISSWMHHLWDAMARRYHALNNHWMPMIVQIFILILQGAFTGLAYWHSPEANEPSVPRDGVLFTIMLFSMLSTMVESLESNQFTLLQQTRAIFYRSSTEAVATTLFDIPLTFLTQSCLSAIIYALAGLRGSVSHFLSFLLFVVSTSSTIKLLFRSIALVVTRETAYSAAGSIIVLLLLFSGFVDLSSSVSMYARWLTWLNPLRYMFEGLVVNEHHDIVVPCATYSPEGTDYDIVSPLMQACLTAASGGEDTSLSGDEYFEAKYGYSYSNLWINFGFVLAFAVTFFGPLLLISEWTSPAFRKTFTLFLRGTQDQGAKNDKPDVYRHIRRDRRVSKFEGGGQYEIPLNDVFAWKNLHYSVPRRKEQNVLLNGISGYVAPRKLCALVGQHGTGKTTLLNVLSGRYERGTLSGDVHLNGASLPPSFPSQVGFVQKTDTYSPKQTVREALRFSANLRQATHLPQHEKDAYIDSCLKMCGLEDYADAMICTLSLEIRKRASIGVELAAQPRLLLFLDEPTSGLDPQEALSVIALLRDLANHGQAILCSIHRPSSEVLAHFDQLLVLHKGSKMVYFGDIGQDFGSMIDYFERNGARPCAPTENPIEWMMNAISADDHAYIPVDWPGKWLRSLEIAQLRRDIDEFQRKPQQSRCLPKQCSTRSPTSWPRQTFLLLRRTFVTYWRSPGYLLAKLSINLLSGPLIGLSFYQSENSLQGVQGKIFAAFLLTIVCIPVSIQLQTVLMEARLVYESSERYCRMYSWTAFLVSHTLVELFWNIVSSIIFFSAWYFATGFPLDRVAYSLLAIGFLYPLFYTTQALAVTSPSSSTRISSSLLCLSFSFTGIFGGVTAPSEHSLWQRWLYGTSPLTYLLEGFIGQALGNQLIQCSPTEFFQLTPSSTMQTCSNYLETFIDKFGGYVDNLNSTDVCQYCPARTTDEYLASRYNIQYGHRWRNVWIVLAACILNICLMFALTYIFRIRRGRLSCAGRRAKT